MRSSLIIDTDAAKLQCDDGCDVGMTSPLGLRAPPPPYAAAGAFLGAGKILLMIATDVRYVAADSIRNQSRTIRRIHALYITAVIVHSVWTSVGILQKT